MIIREHGRLSNILDVPLQLVCPFCRCNFMIEKGDKYTIDYHCSYDDMVYLHVECPECKYDVALRIDI